MDSTNAGKGSAQGSTREVLGDSGLSCGDVWRPHESHTLTLAPQDAGSLCPLPGGW